MQCPNDEDQRHVFIHCQPVLKQLNYSAVLQYEDIFGTLHEQVNVIKVFSQIELTRNHIKKNHLLPGGGNCQDPCTFGHISNGAADIIGS